MSLFSTFQQRTLLRSCIEICSTPAQAHQTTEREAMSANDKEPRMSPLPNYGDHMPIADWLEAVHVGLFIDYDGSGDYATATEVSDQPVYPSDITKLKKQPPAWATHVVWYNK